MTTATLNGQIHATGGTTTPAAPGFGACLRAMRDRAGYSQQRLAQQADLETSYVSRLESGSRWPSPEATMNIAYALGLDIPARVRLMGEAGYRDPAVSVDALVALVTEGGNAAQSPQDGPGASKGVKHDQRHV